MWRMEENARLLKLLIVPWRKLYFLPVEGRDSKLEIGRSPQLQAGLSS